MKQYFVVLVLSSCLLFAVEVLGCFYLQKNVLLLG
jgi:hypothetical protein